MYPGPPPVPLAAVSTTTPYPWHHWVDPSSGRHDPRTAALTSARHGEPSPAASSPPPVSLAPRQREWTRRSCGTHPGQAVRAVELGAVHRHWHQHQHQQQVATIPTTERQRRQRRQCAVRRDLGWESRRPHRVTRRQCQCQGVAVVVVDALTMSLRCRCRCRAVVVVHPRHARGRYDARWHGTAQHPCRYPAVAVAGAAHSPCGCHRLAQQPVWYDGSDRRRRCRCLAAVEDGVVTQRRCRCQAGAAGAGDHRHVDRPQVRGAALPGQRKRQTRCPLGEQVTTRMGPWTLAVRTAVRWSLPRQSPVAAATVTAARCTGTACVGQPSPAVVEQTAAADG